MIHKINKKKVRFNGFTIFIVSYTKDRTSDELWWSDEDYFIAKVAAREEMMRLITIHKSITLKDVLKLLYQPNNISFNEDNFH
jgi:hypothetical protein